MSDVDVMARPMLEGGSPVSGTGFDGFLRSGATIELKAFTGVTGDAGGYAIPKEIDEQIDATLKAISPIRSVANVVKVGSAGYRKLVTTGGTPSGWAAETDARPGTGTPTFVEIAPPMGELYANPSASQAMLDDAAFDVEAWLAGEIAMEFAKAEGSAFVNGSGVGRPKGFLQQAIAATGDATRSFGALQYVPTGAAGDFAANPQEKLIDLVQTLRAPYRQGAVFVMNAATVARIRKFKTSDGAFVWQPSLQSGQPSTLLGYPVIESEDMPDIAANSLSVAFGNFKRGYIIAERSETEILRDPYSNKPFVNFYATALLDMLVQPAVVAGGLDTPPSAPVAGQAWIIGPAPTGAWAGHAGEIAGWTAGGWRFAIPAEGYEAWSVADGFAWRFAGGGWSGAVHASVVKVAGKQVVGAQRPAITEPSAGSVIDEQARSVIGAVLSALREHGLIAA